MGEEFLIVGLMETLGHGMNAGEGTIVLEGYFWRLMLNKEKTQSYRRKRAQKGQTGDKNRGFLLKPVFSLAFIFIFAECILTWEEYLLTLWNNEKSLCRLYPLNFFL